FQLASRRRKIGGRSTRTSRFRSARDLPVIKRKDASQISSLRLKTRVTAFDRYSVCHAVECLRDLVARDRAPIAHCVSDDRRNDLREFACKHAAEPFDLGSRGKLPSEVIQKLRRIWTLWTRKLARGHQRVKLFEVILEIWFKLEDERWLFGSSLER